jgi:DNA ligase (NAD+)
VDRLRHEIEQANYSYFVLDAPALADAEYDAIMRELRALEEAHPELRDPDSPTQRVCGAVAQGFKPRRHPVPMLSLANAFNPQQLDAWLQRVRNIVPDATLDFVCEPKIDGLAIALTYERGRFRVGATRGNGVEGEDVTANLRTMAEVPHDLMGDDVPEGVEVRGEVYMSSAGFEALNERRAAEGQPLFANPRNSAAGSLRQLDPAVTAARPLHLWAYALGYIEGMAVETQWEILSLLRAWGFPVNPEARHFESFDDVHAYCRRMEEMRDRLPYEIDGAVIKINSIACQEELGVVGREPRWAIAYKFPPLQGTTRLLSIEVNVGRTGAINPYAVLEPVTVSGVTIRTATLHNEEDINRKDIRVGDWVIVHRAGDVIPQVVKPLPERRDGTQVPYQLPELCPSCGTPIVKPEGEAMARCPNIACPAQRVRWLEHFVSEPAMDIRGLGTRLTQSFLDEGLIRDPADLYGVTREQILALPGFQDKSVNNLLRAIDRSKRRPLANVIFALGIRFVGMQTAELLSQAFSDLDELLQAPVERLEAVEGIGRKTAESIIEWREQEWVHNFLARFKAAGVTWREQPAIAAAGPLTGKTFIITGALESLKRPQAEAKLKELGAKIAPGMTKAVDYLIAGASPGSKLDRARKLGTPVKDEGWLMEVLGRGALPEE